MKEIQDVQGPHFPTRHALCLLYMVLRGTGAGQKPAQAGKGHATLRCCEASGHTWTDSSIHQAHAVMQALNWVGPGPARSRSAGLAKNAPCPQAAKVAEARPLPINHVARQRMPWTRTRRMPRGQKLLSVLASSQSQILRHCSHWTPGKWPSIGRRMKPGGQRSVTLISWKLETTLCPWGLRGLWHRRGGQGGRAAGNFSYLGW